MFFKNIFSERLKSLRLNNKLTQKSLGNAMGLTDAAVTQMEKEKRAVSVEVLCALADYFDVSLDYLAGRTDRPLPPDAEAPFVSPDELELLERYRALSPEKRKAIDMLMKQM